jgi:hypothetical protein
MQWHPNWEFVLTVFIAIAAVIQAVAAAMIYRLERTIDSASRRVDLGVTLGNGAWGDDDEQIHDQYWIEVSNCSQAGVRLKAITIEAKRLDGRSHKVTEQLNEVVNPYAARKINIHSPMDRVIFPLYPELPKPVPVKGRVSVTLKYRAFGNELSSEVWEFNGEIVHGKFYEVTGPCEVQVLDPESTPASADLPGTPEPNSKKNLHDEKQETWKSGLRRWRIHCLLRFVSRICE